MEQKLKISQKKKIATSGDHLVLMGIPAKFTTAFEH